MIWKAAAILIKENKLLIVKSTKGSTWISPGGKYEKNETPEECLSRELQEELKIKLKKAIFYKTYQEKTAVFDGVPLQLDLFFVEYEGILSPASEILECYWATPEEVLTKKLNVASGIQRLVPDLIEDGYLKN